MKHAVLATVFLVGTQSLVSTPALSAAHSGAASTIPGSASAEPQIIGEVPLNPNHPQQYTVAKGDTLWDIAGRFLANPWQWKTIWKANPAIKNPDLIYPGDLISLTWINGQPALQLTRNKHRTIKLSPKAKPRSLDAAIPSLPIDNIEDFLTRNRVIDEDEFKTAPYILRSQSGATVLAFPGDKAYVRGLKDDKVRRYGVFSLARKFYEPGTDTVFAREGVYHGDVTLVRRGDPATVRIDKTIRTIEQGNRLFPIDNNEDLARIVPFPAPPGSSSTIIMADQEKTDLGALDIVYLAHGSAARMKVGMVFDIYRSEGSIEDPVLKEATTEKRSELAQILWADPLKDDALPYGDQRLSRELELPYEKLGTLVVFKTTKRVSTAIIMEANQPIEVGDIIATPTPGE